MASMFNQFQCLALLILVVGATAATNRLSTNQNPMSVRHEQWMAKHGRVYKDDAEKEHRFKIFKQNVEYIESFNSAGNHKYKLGVNKFSDLTTEEFMASHTGFILKPSDTHMTSSSFMQENLTDVPASMDWRSQGAVTDIKNQEGCGCCWAFSAVAAMEGIVKINSGNLISLSEQEILDCDSADHGCQGGNMGNAYSFIVNNGGLASEASYPYDAIKGTCDTSASPVASISGYQTVPANDEQSLMQAVAQQPVAVAINASPAFQSYSGGVFNGPCSANGVGDLNHAVTIIGYGTDSDTEVSYWLIKNQWGTSWGEGGYMRIQKDVGSPEGLCGLAMYAVYPTA